MLPVLYVVACGVIGWLAHRRGLNGLAFFLLSLILTPLVTLIVLLLTNAGHKVAQYTPADVGCPHCSHRLKHLTDIAYCSHCGERI